jgi:hypothetical protein
VTYSVQKHNNGNCDVPGLAAVPISPQRVHYNNSFSIDTLHFASACMGSLHKVNSRVREFNVVCVCVCICLHLLSQIPGTERISVTYEYLCLMYTQACSINLILVRVLSVKKKFNRCTMEIYIATCIIDGVLIGESINGQD